MWTRSGPSAAKKSKLSNNEKGVWRSHRNRLKEHFEGRDVSEAVSKVVADTAWSYVSPPGDLNISLPYCSPLCEITASSPVEAFNAPFKIFYNASKEEQDLTFWESMWGTRYREMHANAITLKAEMVAVMKGAKSAMASTTLPSCPKFSPELPKSDAETTKWFDLAEVNPAILVGWTETLEISPESNPFCRLPQWLQVMSGACVCIALEPECVQRVGDVLQWLETCESGELAQQPMWYLTEGDAVFAPAGYHVVTVGVPITVKMSLKGVDVKACKDNQKHSYALSIYPMFDDAWMETMPSATKGVMSTWWAAAEDTIPDSWKKVEKVQRCKKVMFRMVAESNKSVEAGNEQGDGEGAVADS